MEGGRDTESTSLQCFLQVDLHLVQGFGNLDVLKFFHRNVYIVAFFPQEEDERLAVPRERRREGGRGQYAGCYMKGGGREGGREGGRKGGQVPPDRRLSQKTDFTY